MQQLVKEKSAKEDEGGSVTVSVVVPETEVPVDSTTSAEEAQPQQEDHKENSETKEGVSEGGAEKEDPAPISHADVERPGSKLSRIEEEPEPAPQPE